MIHFLVEPIKFLHFAILMQNLVHFSILKIDGEARADESSFRSLVRSLLYLTTTRTDLMFSSNLLSRFMQSPSLTHFGVGKRILRYLRGILDYGIWYEKSNGTLVGYVDNDWVGCYLMILRGQPGIFSL